MVFRKYRNPSGLFFLLFSFFACAWFILYFLFFSGIPNKDWLLMISRLDFAIGILGVYSLLGFIYFFNTKPSKLFVKEVLWILGWMLSVLAFYVFTKGIIAGLYYEASEKVFREIPGKVFALHIALHATCVFLFCYFSFKQLKKQTYLNRIRLKHILTSAFMLVLFLIVFQLILPSFGIWILEKEVVFSLAIFVLYIYLTINRYYFSRGFGMGKASVTVLSAVL